jgi:hypothetical protein
MGVHKDDQCKKRDGGFMGRPQGTSVRLSSCINSALSTKETML